PSAARSRWTTSSASSSTRRSPRTWDASCSSGSSMIFEVIPSIDLLDGNVVRLQRGSFDDVTVYSDNPLDTAKRWEIEGASRLHVVDLDGARSGEPKQREIVESIVAETSL